MDCWKREFVKEPIEFGRTKAALTAGQMLIGIWLLNYSPSKTIMHLR
jgi:hypothetical protein